MPITSQPVYGYLKGPDGHFVVDPEAAPVVKQIFSLCLAGNGPTKIARMLTEQNIPTPGTMEYRRTGSTRRYYPDYPGKCTMCYRCFSNCPKQAITIIGKQVYEQSKFEKYESSV